MLYGYAFIDGGLFAALMYGLRLLLMILRPEAIALLVRPAIREQMSAEYKKVKTTRFILTTLSGAIVLAAIVIAFQYRHQPVDFHVLFGHCFIVVMIWQAVDLFLFDWLLLCTLTPKFLMVATSSDGPSIRNYGYYAHLFLKGFIPYCMGTTLIAGIAYSLLKTVL